MSRPWIFQKVCDILIEWQSYSFYEKTVDVAYCNRRNELQPVIQIL